MRRRRVAGVGFLSLVTICSHLLWDLFGAFAGGAGRRADAKRSSQVARHFFFAEPEGSPNPIPDAPDENAKHLLKGSSMYPPWPAGMEEAMFGMGCFWCSENIYMRIEGVYSTQVGYAGGKIPNPSYRDVCSGQTGHNEVVRIVFDPNVVSYASLLKFFWDRHDPTVLNAQGNDMGTQYRSGIYYYNEAQKTIAERSKEVFSKELKKIGRTAAVTEILPAPKFYYAEDYHQQYDARAGSRQYCGLRPTGANIDVGDYSPSTAAA